MKKILLYYIFSILLFGGIYYFYWFNYPDSFSFSPTYNLRPISSNEIIEDKFNLETFQVYANDLRVKYKNVSDEIKILEKQKIKIKDNKDKSYNDFDTSRWQEIKEWENSNIDSSLYKKLSEIQNKINYSKNDLIKAGLEVDKAEINLELAEKKAKNSTYILDNLSKFGDSVKLKKFKEIDSIYASIEYDKIPNLNSKKYELDYEINNLRFNALSQIKNRVSFLDFLLFSASNSSTITYGDITPNDNIMKIVLFIQAIICIILISSLTEKILKK